MRQPPLIFIFQSCLMVPAPFSFSVKENSDARKQQAGDDTCVFQVDKVYSVRQFVYEVSYIDCRLSQHKRAENQQQYVFSFHSGTSVPHSVRYF